MAGRGFFAAAAMMLLLCACSSRADRASRAALAAEGFLQQGDLGSALESARQATNERDDISDYWQLLARIELAAGHAPAAYGALQRVLELDPNNTAALTALGRLGTSLGQYEDVDRYADRLLAADSANRDARVMKAAAALARGDKAAAERYVDLLLAANPSDGDGLILKARLMAGNNDARGAARLVEGTLNATGDDPTARLSFLRTLYARTGDRANLLHTLERMSAAGNASADTRLAYAAMLYEDGRPGAADAVIAQVMRAAPDNLDTASSILETWRDAGPGVPPAATLAAADPSLSLVMKAVKAQRANDLGRPDLALALLGPGVARMATNPTNADARAAYAGALALRGDTAAAGAILKEILAVDPAQPRALLARARLAAARRNFTAAIADARRVVSDDPKNVTARVQLAEYLRGNGQTDLALAQLHEGAQAVPDNARMAGRLAETLIASGDKTGARDALSELVHAAPNSLRAWRLQARLCDAMGDPVCAAGARRGMAAVQGGGAQGG